MQWKRNNGIKQIEVKEDSERPYNEKLQKRLGGSVWATDCDSWYKRKSGKIIALWPDFTFRFRNLSKDFDQQLYKSS
ncbi:MAG: hypothetical protein ACI91G_001555 [Gammaproteobacteria bacterium]|jgi:hypothetical protein